MTAMTREEYEERQQRLAADIDDARKTLQNAKSRFDQLCEEARNLREDWQEQQRRANTLKEER